MTIIVKELEGRPHFVVPMVMIVEGVLWGSNGPLLYPRDELQRTSHLWNGRPVVAYHPRMAHASYAGSPEVFNSQKIGVVFNSRMDGRRLLAQAWIDVQRVLAVDPRIHAAISDRQMMEVSTGLVLDRDECSGAFNGIPYDGIARNYRPDHLAVLPDEIGACSIVDGAGFVRNSVNALDPLPTPAWC